MTYDPEAKSITVRQCLRHGEVMHGQDSCPECDREALDAITQSATLPDGVACGHPGCLSHVLHPCEGCGRVGGRRR